MVQIGEEWYIFYHRHTNGTWYSRQGCAEKLQIMEDGSVLQARLSSCGLNGGPLLAEGEYPAYIACHLFTEEPSIYVDEKYPKIMQDGRDGDREDGYIAKIVDGTTIGFRSFTGNQIGGLAITTRGYGKGYFEIRTSLNGPVLGRVSIEYTNVWETYTTILCIEEEEFDLYLTYRGEGCTSLKSFAFRKD